MLKRLAILACAAALSAACGQSDAGITTAVKAKLAADTMVRAYEIDVDTRNRVVTLSGEVETTAAREQAMQIARETEGVRDVVDQMRVAETAPTAGVLENDPRAGVDAPDVDIDADRRAESTADEAQRRAGDAADRAGEMANRAGERLTDGAVTAAVKAKLLADTAVSGLQIDVDTRNGVVTLDGRVNTRAEAEQAERLARQTEGVSRVVNNLRVGS